MSKSKNEVIQDIREIKTRHFDDSLHSKRLYNVFTMEVDTLSGEIIRVHAEKPITVSSDRILRDLEEYLSYLGPLICIGTKANGSRVGIYDILIDESNNGEVDFTMEMGIKWW